MTTLAASERPVTVDKTGRVLLPVEIRRHLRLEEGDYVVIKVEGDEVVVRRVRWELDPAPPAAAPVRQDSEGGRA